jgi:hypothetical protein
VLVGAFTQGQVTLSPTDATLALSSASFSLTFPATNPSYPAFVITPTSLSYRPLNPDLYYPTLFSIDAVTGLNQMQTIDATVQITMQSGLFSVNTDGFFRLQVQDATTQVWNHLWVTPLFGPGYLGLGTMAVGAVNYAAYELYPQSYTSPTVSLFAYDKGTTFFMFDAYANAAGQLRYGPNDGTIQPIYFEKALNTLFLYVSHSGTTGAAVTGPVLRFSVNQTAFTFADAPYISSFTPIPSIVVNDASKRLQQGAAVSTLITTSSVPVFHTISYNTAGSYSIPVPANAFGAVYRMSGAGGGGGAGCILGDGGGGGGSGGYLLDVPVLAGDVIHVTLGAGGVGGSGVSGYPGQDGLASMVNLQRGITFAPLLTIPPGHGAPNVCSMDNHGPGGGVPSSGTPFGGGGTDGGMGGAGATCVTAPSGGFIYLTNLDIGASGGHFHTVSPGVCTLGGGGGGGSIFGSGSSGGDGSASASNAVSPGSGGGGGGGTVTLTIYAGGNGADAGIQLTYYTYG